ncbi:Dynein heavy chain 5, axonemal [Gryllus bimaculatus]|nr:Dynein heavy chain 5, axonemal [Gryllus bimaculatus]
MYVFALVWGLGAFLDLADRQRFDEYMRERLPKLQLPQAKPGTQETSIFDFAINKKGAWELWSKLLTSYAYPENSTPDYSSILVPIVENVRVARLVELIAEQGHAVLLIGEQGSAKTVMMKAFMRRLDPDKFLSRSFNFSSATSPFQFQVTLFDMLLH